MKRGNISLSDQQSTFSPASRTFFLTKLRAHFDSHSVWMFACGERGEWRIVGQESGTREQSLRGFPGMDAARRKGCGSERKQLQRAAFP